jgi:hypothetical protein
MCEQCSAATNSYSSLEDKVLGKYFLVRATRDGNEMKNMDWGLVTCNDPDFIFAETPWPCPFWYLSDDQIDALANGDKDELFRWEAAAEKFSGELLGSLSSHYGLTEISGMIILAMKHGWNSERDESHSMGWRFERWLFQYLGEYILRHPSPLTSEELAKEDNPEGEKEIVNGSFPG